YLVKSEITPELLRKCVQYILRHKALMAESIQREKLAAIGTLCAGVAHELNNPITIALSYARMIEDDGPLNDAQKNKVTKIIRSCERMAKIVRHLLVYARRQEDSNDEWETIG